MRIQSSDLFDDRLVCRGRILFVARFTDSSLDLLQQPALRGGFGICVALLFAELGELLLGCDPLGVELLELPVGLPKGVRQGAESAELAAALFVDRRELNHHHAWLRQLSRLPEHRADLLSHRSDLRSIIGERGGLVLFGLLSLLQLGPRFRKLRFRRPQHPECIARSLLCDPCAVTRRIEIGRHVTARHDFDVLFADRARLAGDQARSEVFRSIHGSAFLDGYFRRSELRLCALGFLLHGSV
jgi:hypothetical protein